MQARFSADLYKYRSSMPPPRSSLLIVAASPECQSYGNIWDQLKETTWQVQTSLRGQVALGCVPELLEGREGTSSAAPSPDVPVTSQKPEQLSGLQQTRSCLVTCHIRIKVLPKLFSLLLSAADLGIFLGFFLSSDAIKMKQYFKSFFWTCSFCSDHKELS